MYIILRILRQSRHTLATAEQAKGEIISPHIAPEGVYTAMTRNTKQGLIGGVV